jgi:hypothetical protein
VAQFRSLLLSWLCSLLLLSTMRLQGVEEVKVSVLLLHVLQLGRGRHLGLFPDYRRYFCFQTQKEFSSLMGLPLVAIQVDTWGPYCWILHSCLLFYV